jgi:hypothetical protein
LQTNIIAILVFPLEEINCNLLKSKQTAKNIVVRIFQVKLFAIRNLYTSGLDKKEMANRLPNILFVLADSLNNLFTKCIKADNDI